MHTDLSTEIARYFIISFPQVLFSILATFIVLKKEIKQFLPKILIVSILYSFIALITFNFIQITLVKMIIALLTSFILFKVIFKTKWFQAILVILVQSLFSFFHAIFGTIISLYILKIPFSQFIVDKSVWIKALVPSYILSIIIAYILRFFGNIVLQFLFKIDLTRRLLSYRPLLIAIILQLLLIFTFLAQFFIDAELNRNTDWVLITFFMILTLNIYILAKSVFLTEKQIVTQNQATVSDNIMELINSIRSQRHDFINNLQIINSLLYEGNYDELNRYITKLNNEVTVYNDLLKINQPIIGALLNSKIAQAEMNGIKVNIDINANLSKLATKAYDITRILGNLIDNAVDAILQNNIKDKWINLIIEEKGPLLIFSIKNLGTMPKEIVENSIFEPGFTTKDDSHYGLGLYISKQLAKKLHGKIEFDSTGELGTTFSLVLPKV